MTGKTDSKKIKSEEKKRTNEINELVAQQKKLEDCLNEEKQKYNELEVRYKRVLADYDNLSKRYEEEREKTVKFANENLIRQLVVVLDELILATEHVETHKEGILKVVEKFKEILNSSGVEEIAAQGTDFDPKYHEAIEAVPGEANKVIKVYRTGYLLSGRVIRPALVAVGNGSKN